MTRKDFELIARVISDSGLPTETKLDLADRFAFELSHTNPRFDWQRFVTAATK